MKNLQLAAIVAAGTLGFASAVSAAHIDLFDGEGFNVSSTNVLDSGTETDLATPGTAGNASTRTVTLTSIAGGLTSFDFDGNAATGAVYTGAAGSVGVAVFSYGDFAVPGGSDFLNIRDALGTDQGMNWDRIQFTFADLEDLQIIASLTDVDGTEFDHAITALVGTGNGNTNVFSLRYSDFAPDANSLGTTPGLDLENIAEFAFSFGIPTFNAADAAGAQSFRLLDVRRAGAVPVPASLLLLVAGLGGIVVRRKLNA